MAARMGAAGAAAAELAEAEALAARAAQRYGNMQVRRRPRHPLWWCEEWRWG